MKRRIWLHILFWFAQWFIYAYIYGRYDNNFERTFISEGLQLPARIVSTYLSFYLLNLVDRRRLMPLVLVGIALLTILAGLANRILKLWYLVPTYFPEYTIKFWDLTPMMVDIFDCILSTATALVLRLMFRQQESRRREEMLQAEKVSAELQALKNQIHPHFLFNTINNLYALARIRSEKTAAVALQLANLLRYVLYDSAKPEVRLEHEIQNLEDYIALEKLRFDEDRLKVYMTIEIDNPDQMVAPLLLLPLVENAFKHGVSEKRHEAWVILSIVLKDKVLTVHIENSKTEEKGDNPEGIGLRNLQRQLELLYPGRHGLKLNSTPGAFTADLELQC